MDSYKLELPNSKQDYSARLLDDDDDLNEHLNEIKVRFDRD
jgi:hypothetical protein